MIEAVFVTVLFVHLDALIYQGEQEVAQKGLPELMIPKDQLRHCQIVPRLISWDADRQKDRSEGVSQQHLAALEGV